MDGKGRFITRSMLGDETLHDYVVEMKKRR